MRHWIGPLQSCDANRVKTHYGAYYSPDRLSDWRCRCQSEYFPMWITWGYAATIMEAEHESSEYWHLDIIQWIAFLPIIKILSSDVFSQFISDAMIKSETFVFEDLMWLKKYLICFYINVISQHQTMPCKQSSFRWIIMCHAAFAITFLWIGGFRQTFFFL